MDRSTINALAQRVRAGGAATVIEHLTPVVGLAAIAGLEHAVLIEAWLAVGDRKQGLAVLQGAVALPIESADVADALAYNSRQLDQHETSNVLYRRATALAPEDPGFWYNLATSERTMGRLDEAQEACRRALVLAPDYRPAILLRSEVRKASTQQNHIDELKRRLTSSGETADTMFLQYALGKELHDLGDYDGAFAAFASGARLRRASLDYDVATDEAKLARIVEAFGTTPDACAGGTAQHVFIVGMPRSGTTLTERILGGLAGVHSNNETNNFSTALLAGSPQVGDVFANCAAADNVRVAAEYNRLAVPDHFQGRVIEKLPFNYLYVGAIWRAFPGVPIIWVRRNPVDNCFAMFRTLFGAAYPFSYDFSDLARYFAAYQKLMAHWEQLYPDTLIKVDYEKLVGDPAIVGADLASRCGLSWDSAALDLGRNRSASLTASAAQVRGDIYASSSGLWRKYEKHLEPLITALEHNRVQLDW